MTNYEIVLKARLDEAHKRIAELEEGMGKAYEMVRGFRTYHPLFRGVTDILEDCLQAEETRHISEGGTPLKR